MKFQRSETRLNTAALQNLKNFCIVPFLVASLFASRATCAGNIEVVGIPIKGTMIGAMAAGVDEKGEGVFYFSCSQPGNHLFLLQANPRAGTARQWSAPVGEGAWALVVAPDNRVYLGTWESGYLLRFDPSHPEKGIESLGKPSSSETYIWQLAVGNDGSLYGCTYPGAKLVHYDPASGKNEDLGRLDSGEMYSRSVAVGSNGFVYIGIGTKHAQVVRYDPSTKERKPLLKEGERPTGTAQVFRAADGKVYASIGTKYFLCEPDSLKAVAAVPPRPLPKTPEGTELLNSKAEAGVIRYEISDQDDKRISRTATFESAGLTLFQVGAGPNGKIFGGTALPLEMFEFDPAGKNGTGRLADLGNPTDVGGEIYSFAADGPLLYVCAYPGSFLSVYDPAKPWHYGKAKDSNPRGIGPMGDGHLRPRAMVAGRDHRIYVGSLPPYGQVGGALGIYDSKADAIVENYRNVITNQGINSLCFSENPNVLFGGSSTEGGGGATPVARQAVAFAWDVSKHSKLWESNIIAGDTVVSGLSSAAGRIFGVSLPSSTLFVVNPTNYAVLAKSKIPFGHFHDTCLGYYPPEKKLYGLTGNAIISINPETYEMTQVAQSLEPIRCGFAVTETGLYFGSGAKLCRYAWKHLSAR